MVVGRTLIAVSVCLASVACTTTGSRTGDTAFQWPDGAQAAVTLTYDDSLASHLDVVLPQLNTSGLKGTFFLQGNGGTMNDRLEDWRRAAAAGHELGSHTLVHPCRKGLPGREWVASELDLDQYTPARYERELELMDTLLYAIDGERGRTFAYPCGDTVIGHGTHSLKEIVAERYLASRGVRPELAGMRELRFSETPAFDPSGKDLAASITYLENCARDGTVAVFLMHGVGGDYLVTDAELHRQLLEYLVQHRERYWVDTFGKVLGHARSEFNRLGWSVE